MWLSLTRVCQHYNMHPYKCQMVSVLSAHLVWQPYITTVWPCPNCQVVTSSSQLSSCHLSLSVPSAKLTLNRSLGETVPWYCTRPDNLSNTIFSNIVRCMNDVNCGHKYTVQDEEAEVASGAKNYPGPKWSWLLSLSRRLLYITEDE